MDIAKLVTNLGTAWQRRAGVSDFCRNAAWIYSRGLPAALTPRQWDIGFRYPAPIGSVRLCLRSNNGADAFTHSEVFELQYYRLPLRAAPATLLDLGANIGLSAIYFARLFPDCKLACVEPVPDNVRLLRRNLELNGVNAEVIAGAVDTRDGTVAMERVAMDYGHKLAGPTSPATSLFEVAGISIPSIMRRTGWQRINLLKIDIEGHEKHRLSQDCGWLHDVDAMCLEYHHHNAEAELTRVADQFGFQPPQWLPGHIWLLTR